MRLRAVAVASAFVMLVLFSAFSEAQSTSIGGTIIAVKGEGEVRRAGGSTWEPARARMVLYAGDVVRTGRLGVVSMVLADESLVKLLDPFAIRTLSLETKYWTLDDRNTQWLGFAGPLLRGVLRESGDVGGERLVLLEWTEP